MCVAQVRCCSTGSANLVPHRYVRPSLDCLILACSPTLSLPCFTSYTVAGSGSKLSVAYIVVAAEAFEIGAQVMNAHEIVWQPHIHTATL